MNGCDTYQLYINSIIFLFIDCLFAIDEFLNLLQAFR